MLNTKSENRAKELRGAAFAFVDVTSNQFIKIFNGPPILRVLHPLILHNHLIDEKKQLQKCRGCHSNGHDMVVSSL